MEEDRRARLPSRALVALVAAAVLGASWWAASDGEVPGWESRVLRAVNDLPDALELPLEVLMVLGTIVAPFALATGLAVVTRRLRPALDLVVAALLSAALSALVKEAVERERPGPLGLDVEVRDPEVDGFGFVSGHAAMAFAVATSLAPSLPRAVRPVAYGLATVVALARLHEGVHLPLDAIGGAATGVLAALAGRTLIDRAIPRSADPTVPP